jgi:hypothetical protein
VPLEEEWSAAAGELRERTMSLEQAPAHLPGWMIALAALIGTVAIGVTLFTSRGSLKWLMGA